MRDQPTTPVVLDDLTPAELAEFTERLSMVVDLRIAAAWQAAFAKGIENLDADALGSLLRFAYTAGYTEALTETERGQLFTQMGIVVPDRE